MALVYLAGPITGVSYDECVTGWRHQVNEYLGRHGIVCLSPMRGKPPSDFSEEARRSMKAMGNETPLSTPKAILVRDHYDCVRSDAVLFNLLGARKLSAGTIMELAWCYDRRIPTVVVMESDNLHHHAMIDAAADWIVGDLQEGVDIIMHILSTGV